MNMRYQVVYGSVVDGARQINDVVNREIQLGWRPIGGIAHSQHYLWQAMVKHEEEDE